MFDSSVLRTALAAAAFAAATGAHADPALYQSAAFVDFMSAGEPGGYFIDDSRAIGSAFVLTKAADVTAIGGYFSVYSDGDIFGAIVPLASLTSVPSGPISSIALGHAVFAADGSDQQVALPLHLGAGTYGVVFGSGLYGATGTSALVSSQLSGGNHTFSGAASSWLASGDADVRTVVYGVTAAVPEPASWGSMLGGLGAVGLVLRRQRKAA